MPSPSDRPRDAGAVTVELALGLPVLVLLVAVVQVTTATGIGSLRCADAARTGARLAAVREADSVVALAARRVAGGGVGVTVRHQGAWVEVVVEQGAVGGWFTGGPVAIRGAATAWIEP